MSDSWKPTASIETLKLRAEFLHSIRQFFQDRGVVEVQTPVLAPRTVTDVAIDSIAVPSFGFLQTSPEFLIKRLLAAGMPSCYQLGPVFRADERGRWHNPEFTMLEWYRLGFSLADLQAEVAELVNTVLGEGDFETIKMGEWLEDSFGLDIHDPDQEAIQARAKDEGLLGESNWREALDYLVSVALNSQKKSRLFLTEYPTYMSALAQCSPNENGTQIAQRFELVINGIEIANAYQELADADELLARAQVDNEERIAIGKAPIALDSAFHAAMRDGLPECCGVALGIDRLFAISQGAESLREVTAF